MRPLTSLIVVLCCAVAAGCGGDAGGGSDSQSTRSVKTARGVVEVPSTPKRVVVLDSGELDLALSLGIKPVGYATSEGAVEAVQPYLAERVKGAKVVGTNSEPNIERIAALKPDLIIGTEVRVKDLYDKLSAIAPTVLGKTPALWKDNVRLHGEALGKGPQARRELASLSKRAAAIGDKLGDPSRTTVAVVRFLPGEIRLYAPESFIGSILADVGVRLPPTAQRVKGDIDAPLSLEVIDRAKSDVLYTSTYGDPSGTEQARAERLPAWKGLPAVEAGRKYAVDDNVWMLGIGPTGASKVLDDLDRTLVKPGATG